MEASVSKHSWINVPKQPSPKWTRECIITASFTVRRPNTPSSTNRHPINYACETQVLCGLKCPDTYVRVRGRVLLPAFSSSSPPPTTTDFLIQMHCETDWQSFGSAPQYVFLVNVFDDGNPCWYRLISSASCSTHLFSIPRFFSFIHLISSPYFLLNLNPPILLFTTSLRLSNPLWWLPIIFLSPWSLFRPSLSFPLSHHYFSWPSQSLHSPALLSLHSASGYPSNLTQTIHPF